MTASRRERRLERWYRRLLRAYPAGFRRQRTEEVVTTLLAAGKPGRFGLPSLRDAADLVVNGLRARARVTRHTLAAPRTRVVSHDAGLVILAIATAAAVALAVGVAVLGRPMFAPGRNFNVTYPWPVRLGVGVVLAMFPAALAAARTGRGRTVCRFVQVGAVGSAAGAACLVVYALRTRNESLEVSNLFGLVTLLCLPAVFLRGPSAVAAAEPRRLGRTVALAVLLAVPLVLQVADHHAEDDGRGLDDPALLSSRLRLGAVHATGLTQTLVAILVVVAAWHLLRSRYRPEFHRDRRHLGVIWTPVVPHEPCHLAVAWALALPAWGYALGTLLTPMLFRPEMLALGTSRLANLGPHAIELAVASVLVTVLTVIALAALRGAAEAAGAIGRPHPDRPA